MYIGVEYINGPQNMCFVSLWSLTVVLPKLPLLPLLNLNGVRVKGPFKHELDTLGMTMGHMYIGVQSGT